MKLQTAETANTPISGDGTWLFIVQSVSVIDVADTEEDTLRRLEAALRHLSPRTREIFLAQRLGGMSYSEIAQRTGLSVRRVEKHMIRAIAAVDRKLSSP